jgi:hypothetical protein
MCSPRRHLVCVVLVCVVLVLVCVVLVSPEQCNAGTWCGLPRPRELIGSGGPGSNPVGGDLGAMTDATGKR